MNMSDLLEGTSSRRVGDPQTGGVSESEILSQAAMEEFDAGCKTFE